MTKSPKGRAEVPTPPLDDRGLALPPLDPVIALRVMGTDEELRLSPEKTTFTLGALPTPEVALSLPKPHVSRVHCTIQRKGNRLHISNGDSTNGLFFDDHPSEAGEVTAGKTFRVADVYLLALDDRLRDLRPELLRVLGLTDHARVDAALQLIASGDRLLLQGAPGCDQLRLAEAIHRASARRGRAFVHVQPPLATEGERAVVLRHADRGTAFLDLDALPTLTAPFVRELFGTTYHIRPIFAARTEARAQKELGDGHARALRSIAIPPLADRRADIPRLLDDILVNEYQSPRLAASQLPARVPARVLAALSVKAYPKNLDDLRAQAKNFHALLAHDFNKTAAAEALGKSVQALSEWMDRLGF
jgi:hypothetical protein